MVAHRYWLSLTDSMPFTSVTPYKKQQPQWVATYCFVSWANTPYPTYNMKRPHKAIRILKVLLATPGIYANEMQRAYAKEMLQQKINRKAKSIARTTQLKLEF
jgi:hypothetical protein